MKKLLLLLLLASPVFAGFNKYTILGGDATNGYFANAFSNKNYVVNILPSTNDFDSGTLYATPINITNLGIYVRSRSVHVESQNVGVGVGGFSSSTLQTNWIIWSFQRSWDGSNWINWTNVSFQPAASVANYTNFNLILGDYHYMRCNNMSNTSVSPQGQGFKSNFLEIYWKSAP